MVKVLYPWEAVEEYWNQVQAMGKVYKNNEQRWREEDEKIWGPFVDHWKEVGPKYLPELEAWGKSEAVLAKKRHEKKIMEHEDFQDLEDAGEEFWEDIQGMDWGKKPTELGWYEWADNDDLADLFEDLYEVKEKFKALVSNVALMKKNEKLGWKALQDPHFQKMWKWFQKDMKVKGLDGLKRKIKMVGEKMCKRMHDDKAVQKLKKMLFKLIKTVEKTKFEWDVPTDKEFEAWVEKNNFQPWI